MAWKDTLFIWRGDIELHDGNTKFEWKGTWVGVDTADARSAPTPSDSSFRGSKMSFEVGGKIARKEGSDLEFWSGCEFHFEQAFPGWLLDNGDGAERFQDTEHTVLFADGAESIDECFPVFARGTNEFAPFISVGRCIRIKESGEPGDESIRVQLTLARRYLEAKDERAGWSAQQVMHAVMNTTGSEANLSQAKQPDSKAAKLADSCPPALVTISSSSSSGEGGKKKPEQVDTSATLNKKCAAPWQCSAPWRCGMTLHAALRKSTGPAKKKRKGRGEEINDQGDGRLPPLCMHSADFALSITAPLTPTDLEGTFLALHGTNVDFEDQCWGCGGPVHSQHCKRSQCAAGCVVCSECTCGVRSLVVTCLKDSSAGPELFTAEFCGGEGGKGCISRAVPELSRFSAEWKKLGSSVGLASNVGAVEDDFWDVVAADNQLLAVTLRVHWPCPSVPESHCRGPRPGRGIHP